jgi:hypothetical protein
MGGAISSGFSGTLSEFMVINAAPLSNANRERLEGYMAHKWGASGNLPGGHTYELHPPAN